MVRYFLLGLALIVLSAFPAACGEVDSADLSTNDSLFGQISVNANEDGSGTSRVSAEVRVGGLFATTYLDLTGGEHFEAAAKGAPGQNQVLVRNSDFFGRIYYTGNLATDEPGTQFQISLFRNVAPDLANSIVTLPEGLSLTGPAPGASYALSGGIVPVSWTPANQGGSISVDFSGTCGSSLSVSYSGLSDSGSANFSAFDLLGDFEGVNYPCSLGVRVKRSIWGSIDPGYGEGGSISASRSDSLAGTITITQ